MHNITDEAILAAKDKMEKSTSIYKKDLVHIRAGRANPQLLDNIRVDYYGTPTPINQIGNLSSPEPRILVISLWDPKMIPEVEKAIQKSDLGINPSNDGKLIRLLFPELTEERRKDIVKMIRKKSEEAKVHIRSIRRDTNEQLKKMQKEAALTEDDLKDLENDVQKLTDENIKLIDKLTTDKEKEILEV